MAYQIDTQEGYSATTVKILEEMKEDIKNGLMPIQVFNNPDIYKLELRRIFARTWVFIGHETEIPSPGDYAIRKIGEDPFIFVRDENGQIQVLFDSCRHRGVKLCRSDMGNTSHFRCPYHGWTYKNSGDLVGVPAKHKGYRELNEEDWGLLKAPQVANYCGLIFACLDPKAPSFEEYLGSYKWYFDIQFKLTDGGMEVIGEPHRWLVDANWKQGAENFCGDSSHTPMTHRSTIQVGIVTETQAGTPNEANGFHVNDCDGHNISIRQYAAGSNSFFGYPEEVKKHFRKGELSDEQFAMAERAILHDGTLFPNFSFIQIGLKDDIDEPEVGFLSIRTWQPAGPGKAEIWNWILAPKEASEAYKQRAYRAGMSSFSPSGSFEQDDVAVWSGIAQSASTVFAEMNRMKLNYQMSMGSMGDKKPLEDWAGPGEAWASSVGEAGLRCFHRTWYKWMME